MTNDLAARAEPTFQRRSVPLFDSEFRTEGTADGWWTFDGIASTVEHPYAVRDWLGEYTETIKTGAFDRSIKDPEQKISLHLNHQHGKAVPLAVRSPQSETLAVSADPHLRFHARLNPARPDIQVVREAVRDGLMTEMSIGFADVKGGYTWNSTFTERSVSDMRLREASIVEDGCNELTFAAIRSLSQEIARFQGVDVDPAELRRAIAFLERMLPEAETVDEVVETVAGTGVFVTDELIESIRRRNWRPDLITA